MKPIEYIGSGPRKPQSKNFFGGWVIGALAFAAAVFFGREFAPLLLAAQSKPSEANVERAISELQTSTFAGDQLAAAALTRTQSDVTYDGSYYTLSYPSGDIPKDKGMSTDMVIRAYRAVGHDLQKLVHEDMKQHFRLYPQIWSAAGPDASIDHRRVPNLQRFFSRHGEELAKSRDKGDYANGDVVCWFLASGQTHIGIVVPGPGDLDGDKWVIHNIGAGPVWEDVLHDYQVIGHYRYLGPRAAGSQIAAVGK